MLQRINLVPIFLLGLIALISWLVGTWWPLIIAGVIILTISVILGAKDEYNRQLRLERDRRFRR